MAGWCSETDSDEDPLNFKMFVRKSFGFQGLPEDKEYTLKKIVQQIGAKCDGPAKYIFTTAEYFNSLTTHDTPLYNVAYIRDCVDANRCLNIEQYRFGPKSGENKDFRDFDPCCHNFHNGYNACIVCDPTFKPSMDKPKKGSSKDEVPVKQKSKVKSDESKNTSNKTNSENLCTNNQKKNNAWEPWECRLLLDYIICNKLFRSCKSPSVFKRMISEGLMTHRTPESVRLYFRTNILRNIEDYDLPQPIMKTFKRIRSGTRFNGILHGTNSRKASMTIFSNKRKQFQQKRKNKIKAINSKDS